MRHFRLIIFSLLFLAPGTSGLQAQTSISTAGGNNISSSGSVSFSIGQVAYSKLNGSNGSELQGVQQPFEISVVTGINETKEISLLVSAFPNPTYNLLTLKVDLLSPLINQSLSYQLYDMNGELIRNNILEGSQTSIAMDNFVPGTYILRITEGNNCIKTFKIIKK